MKKFKTIVYVDAFNLYYGVLKGTPYKWLNINALVNNLLSNNEIISLKYFTAPVKSSNNNPNRLKNQNTYISALQETIPYFECIKGYFVEKKVEAKHLNPPPDKVNVSLREEKETDVNIAVEIVQDSYAKEFDCIVLISNDSDLGKALVVAKKLGKKIILITPLFRRAMSLPSNRLKKLADIHFLFISSKILKKSLLNKTVGKFLCPKHWNESKMATPHDVTSSQDGS